MNTNNIKLSFTCKECWNKMAPISGGKFCNACKEKVMDFRKSTPGQTENNSASCGLYKATQLEKPFGDWRDKLINTYQKHKLVNKNSAITKKAVWYLALLALFLSGCFSSCFMGKRMPNPNKEKETEKKQSETPNKK